MSNYNNFIKFLTKVLVLSTFLIFIISVGSKYFYTDVSNASSSNSKNYKNTKNDVLGNVGVAITTNLGTRFKQRQGLPASIYKEVMSISEIIGDNNRAKKDLISMNLFIISEYLNVLKTDVKKLVDNSYDKPTTLKVFLQQLKYRYNLAVKNQKNLIKQRQVLEKTMIDSENKIKSLKTKISSNFNSFNSEATLENIDTYLKLRQEYSYARTYIIFINKFLKQYAFLNVYNKDLINTLLNNRDAIVKDAYIVIPDSGATLLKKLNLLYEEKEFKAENN